MSASSRLLKEILDSDDSLVHQIMGDFGVSLKSFVQSVDLTHPELNSLFEDFCVQDPIFLDRCFEFFKLNKYLKENGYNSARISEEKLSNIFNNRLLNKMSNIRLLNNESQRNNLRNLKKSKRIDLRFIYSNKDFWTSYPDSFSPYQRHNSSYEEEANELFKKKEIYLELGLFSLAEETERDLNDLREFSRMYYGYHQIKSSSAAVILARTLKFDFNKEGIFVKDGNNFLNYCPLICPVHDVLENAPPSLKEKVLFMESFPDANGKPIFDLLALIVPTCYVKNLYEERNFKEIANFFVKNSIFNFALIGEKSEKFYFIDLAF